MTEDFKLDRIDRKILGELQADGRLTNQALSDRVALSPSACLARVKRLETAGVIKGYQARLDPFMVSVGLVLFAEVTLSGHSPDELALFEKFIDQVPEVVEASHLTGAYDYLLKVVVADMAHWTRIADSLTSSQIGVERITTHVLMNKPKVFVGYPIKTDKLS
jgi:Lrp/AsnC family leucine-responsive transcriptional regulator